MFYDLKRNTRLPLQSKLAIYVLLSSVLELHLPASKAVTNIALVLLSI